MRESGAGIQEPVPNHLPVLPYRGEAGISTQSREPYYGVPVPVVDHKGRYRYTYRKAPSKPLSFGGPKLLAIGAIPVGAPIGSWPKVEWPHFGCFEGRLCRCMALGAFPWPHALSTVRTLFVTVVLLSPARVDCACLGSCAPREVVNATGSFVPPIARRCRMPRDPLGTCTHDSPPVDHCYSASERYPCILCST